MPLQISPSLVHEEANTTPTDAVRTKNSNEDGLWIRIASFQRLDNPTFGYLNPFEIYLRATDGNRSPAL